MLRAADRRRLRTLYAFRCGYCGVAESDVGAELTLDHYQPVSQGGTDVFENYVYACHACNEFKGDYWQPDGDERILHPFRDDFAVHIAEGNDGVLVGLTPTGRFHIARLQLNRPPLVAHRQALRREAAAQARQREMEERLVRLEAQVREMERHFPITSDNPDEA